MSQINDVQNWEQKTLWPRGAASELVRWLQGLSFLEFFLGWPFNDAVPCTGWMLIECWFFINKLYLTGLEEEKKDEGKWKWEISVLRMRILDEDGGRRDRKSLAHLFSSWDHHRIKSRRFKDFHPEKPKEQSTVHKHPMDAVSRSSLEKRQDLTMWMEHWDRKNQISLVGPLPKPWSPSHF